MECDGIVMPSKKRRATDCDVCPAALAMAMLHSFLQPTQRMQASGSNHSSNSVAVVPEQ